MDSPFYASLALKKEWIEDTTCPTGWTDGTKYGYNPDWIKTLTLPQTKGFMKHEVSHIALNHNLRMGDRDHETFNEAGDYIINPMILEQGDELPPGNLNDPQFKGMYEEQVYDILYARKKKQGKGKPGQGSGDPGGCGEVRPFPSPSGKPKPTPAEIAQQEQAQNIETQQALTAARLAGNLPGNLERLIKDFLEPIIPWREVLARFVDSQARNDYSWQRPNPRYIPHGLYLPILKNPELGNLGFFDDTSGSHFSAEQQQKALSELRGILTAYEKAQLTVIFVDHAIQGEPITIEANDDIDVLIPKGGGGTSFVPPFQWIQENGIDLKAAIYITDGYCDEFPDPPDYEVLWILTNKNESFQPPFGEVIFMGD